MVVGIVSALAYAIGMLLVFLMASLSGPNGMVGWKAALIALTWPVSIPVWWIVEKYSRS